MLAQLKQTRDSASHLGAWHWPLPCSYGTALVVNGRWLARQVSERRLLLCNNPESRPPAAAREGMRYLRPRSHWVPTRSASRNGIVTPMVDAHIHRLVAPNTCGQYATAQTRCST